MSHRIMITMNYNMHNKTSLLSKNTDTEAQVAVEVENLKLCKIYQTNTTNMRMK